MAKVHALYDSLKINRIQSPETVLATAMYETGWMECKHCSMDVNNLFGFMLPTGYVEFSNVSECIAYMKKWQAAYYLPWKANHPKSSYYDFLVFVNYAANMPDYIKTVKSLEHWISTNLEQERAEAADLLMEQ
jgi:hypothetical protein